MDKGPPKDDLKEESEKRVKKDDIEKQNVKIEVEDEKQDAPSATKGTHEESRTLATEEDSGRQYPEDKLKGTRDKTDSKVEVCDHSLDGEESKSEEPIKTGMLPANSFLTETLKEEEKSQTQDEIKQIRSSINLKEEHLASEKRIKEDDTEKQNAKIEVEGKEQDTTSVIKGIHEESRTPDMEKDSVRQYEEDKSKGTRDKDESKVGKLDNSLDGEGSKSEEPSKMGMPLTKSLNRDEALKEEEKSQIQAETKQVNCSKVLDKKSSDILKSKLLALEMELSVDSIERKTTGIFLPSELKRISRASNKTVKLSSEPDIKPPRKGISHKMVTIFTIAAATGTAFRFLPYHLRETTWYGIFFFLLLGLNSLYINLCIGWCWSLMEEIWPEHAAWSRIPYQDMAYRAVGLWMKYVSAFLVDLTTLLLCGNYVITITENTGKFFYSHLHCCYFIIVICAALSFLAMIGSYRNLTFVGATDVILSLLFILVILICLFYDQSRHGNKDFSHIRREGIGLALAGMSHSFGTGIMMPNIVVEMEDRSKFTESVVTAYIIILAMYTVISILGYAAYGNKTPEFLTSFILQNESLKKYGIFIDVLQAVQLSTTFVIYFIPIALALEEFFKCPDRFCLRRVTIRLGIMVVIMILAMGIPRLITHMDVIAATLLSILSFIFPPIFHILLLRKQKAGLSRRTQSVKELILVAEIILFAIIIAILSIYLTVMSAVKSENTFLSCYSNMSLFPLTHTFDQESIS